MTEKDYYTILGVGRNATDNEIKKAYRQLAMQYHPDRNSGNKDAEEKFKEIGQAYQILSDPQKKHVYDQFGESGMRGGGYSNMGGYVDPFDIFREVFGGGFGDIFGSARHGSVKRGSDLQIHLKLSLEEISQGVKKKVKIKSYIVCPDCSGTGSASGSTMTTCPVCHGRGEMMLRQGFFTISQTCPKCHGEGKIIEKPCVKCHGEGRMKGDSTVEFDVPPGVAKGHYLTIRNAGNVGARNAARGDVIIVIDELSHDLFERHGDDIVYNLYVGFTQVALGEEVEVPTLTGKAKITINAGTQSGKILRIRGKGIPNVDTHRAGDLLIRVFVFTPTKLNSTEKRILEELAQQTGMFPIKGDRSFTERMKETF